MTFDGASKMRLLKAWERGETLTIRGVNSYGEMFMTEGKIATHESGECFIFYSSDAESDIVFLDFGLKSNGYDMPFMLPLCTNLIDDEYNAHLYIINIYDSKHQKLYTNPDAAEIYEMTQRTKKEDKKTYQKYGLFIEEELYDSVTKALKTMIGKPVIITTKNGKQKKSGVVSRLELTANHGQMSVLLINGQNLGVVDIDDNAVLEVEDGQGNRKIVAENKAIETRALFEKRLEATSEEKFLGR